MLQFEVHDALGPSRDRPPVRAHLLGRDDHPVSGRVQMKGSRIVCDPEDGLATALCLEMDVGPLGRIMLKTCLLPQRQAPYLLNLELARHQIKQYIVKGEEWLMFDPESGGDSFRIWERARTLFVQAITEGDQGRAETKARESLIAALEAGERLAVIQAEQSLQRRYARRGSTSTLMGVRVDPHLDPAVSGALGVDFDVVAVETPWSLIEPKPGTFQFEAVDRWMTLAVHARRPVVAGPLLRFDAEWLPPWMERFKGDFKAIVDRAYIFMEQVVHRYRAVASLWNLCSGLHTNAWHAFGDSERIDLARRAALLARQSRKGARTLVEFTDPFGETIAGNPGAISAWQFLERLIQEGVHMDAVGMQLSMGGGGAGHGVRDLLQVSSLLDRFLGFDCKVMLSSIGVPSEPLADGGVWRRPWSEAVQEHWAASLSTVALSKPFVETLVWERLGDDPSRPRGRCGVQDASGKSKPVAKRLLGIRNRLRRPLGKPESEAKSPDRAGAESNDETAAGTASA
ncbi:MAG: hypothetical protein EBQ99_05215 [Planctomycetes bacterium]|nr:hypothetical protein [Planctomycetota bacterium]